MKYSQESSLETVYQEMLDSIYKAAKQKLICLLDQKWFFKGSVTYPDLHNINFELKYCGDEEEYFITGICGIRNGVSLSKIILKCDISNGIDSKYTKFEVEYDERKYLDDIEKNINAILKNNRSYKYFCESFNRFLIISLDVLICRYSPLFRAFPALFISEEPHKSFYYPLCCRSQK